ncbi:calphotin [Brachypodium distachyon]|uniref:Uncharacterized protein n=1 Tax=Brachypodium distachyon TaxID=15368 RepID=I1HBE0_BRADI|nr:calphotin [Brachypodium distachyon]KQK02407.1 hypothetical protein BRADI_2g01270v3 [Brachypodium distachyon]|eukprot:XP_003565259.1 calphotin [Brachypodium distachyon]
MWTKRIKPHAVTLLAAITNPTPESAAAKGHPLVLTPGAPPPPAKSSALPTPILPETWSLAPADPTLATAASFLAASLSGAPLSAPRFRTLVTSFLATLSESLSLPRPAAAAAALPEAIRAAAPYFPATLAPLVASAAAVLAEHDVLLALADARALPHPPPGLLAALSDAGRPDLVCAVLRQAADLRSSELLAALRCFLSPASDEAYDAMVGVKGRWKDAAVLAVNKCVEKGAGKKAKPTAMLLMMGHDWFTSPEVCLHYLFASRNVDCVESVVLAAAVAELDGVEVAGLMRYLAKWVGKYRRFPEAQACPEAAGMLGLDQCESVPSFGAVARAMGLVLDQHFSHLVLNAEVRDELRAAEEMVKELAAEAESSGPILDLLRRMQHDV